MSFFTAIEKLRALPEEKRVGVVFSLAGGCTGFIFLLWAMFVFLDNTSQPEELITKSNASSTVSTAPSPADLLVAGIKARNDELLEQTEGLRALLGGDGETEAPATSFGRGGSETNTPSASQAPVHAGGMTDAEKEAILDAYFQEVETQKNAQTQVYPNE